MEQSALIEFIYGQQQLLPMILSIILAVSILVFMSATNRLRRLEEPIVHCSERRTGEKTSRIFCWNTYAKLIS